MAETFNYPAAGPSGGTTSLNIRISIELDRAIDVLFYTRKWPYHTKTDVIRHAIHRHIEWLEDQGAVTDDSSYLRVMSLALDKDAQMTDFSKILDKLVVQVKHHKSLGNQDDIVKLVTDVLRVIEGMPNTGMKTKYKEQVLAEFGHYAGEIIEMPVKNSLVSYEIEDAVKEEE